MKFVDLPVSRDTNLESRRRNHADSKDKVNLGRLRSKVHLTDKDTSKFGLSERFASKLPETQG
jgi:hypothetical protein